MGKEAEVEARWPDGRREHGRLQYEPPKLIFRGAERRVFQGEALARVSAEDRELVLADGVRFRLPTPAASWADAILRPRGRLEKLGVAPGRRIAALNFADPDFHAELGGALADGEGDLDLLFYGADSAEDLARIGDLVPRLAPKGALWTVSLKGKLLQVKDTEVMAAANACGLVGVKVCAFSETRTALKFTRRKG